MLAQRPMHHVPVTVAHRGAACVEMAMLRIVAEDGKNPCLAHLLSRYPTKRLAEICMHKCSDTVGGQILQ